MVSKFFRTLLYKWPWLFVIGRYLGVFKLGDLIVPRPTTMGGEIIFLMTCNIVAALVLGITIFALHYMIGRIKIAVWAQIAGSPS